MAGLDVVTLSSPDCLSGLRAQGLTRRDRRRAARARRARERRSLRARAAAAAHTEFDAAEPAAARELAGRRSCAGCNQAPCARSAAGCFRGVGQANGKYVVRGLDHERYPTAELAARRRDMLLAAGACRSFDEPLNFERSDAKQLKFERDFAAKERKESRKRARSHDDDAPPSVSPRASVPAASPRPRAASTSRRRPGPTTSGRSCATTGGAGGSPTTARHCWHRRPARLGPGQGPGGEPALRDVYPVEAAPQF